MSSPEGDAPPWAPGLRLLTADEPPIGLRFLEHIEDFVVEEIPAFEPDGEGEHLLVEVEKRGLSTPGLVRHLAREFDLAPSGPTPPSCIDANRVLSECLDHDQYSL